MLKKYFKTFPILFAILISLISSVVLSFTDDYTLGVDTIIIFLVAIGLFFVGHVLRIIDDEQTTKWEENKNNHDPEWEEYKRLRNKFDK